MPTYRVCYDVNDPYTINDRQYLLTIRLRRVSNLMHVTTLDALVYMRLEGQRKLNAYSPIRSGSDSIMTLTFGQETNVLT
ncbi:hypothetical protein M0804_003043 [Polistes exclamans]|nr:hypothetical protein M0804_003043 [Polistes exclamans]